MASSDIVKKVNKWREHIDPILEEEEKRADFDIHGCGTSIIGLLGDPNQTKEVDIQTLFSNIRQKDVPRYDLVLYIRRDGLEWSTFEVDNIIISEKNAYNDNLR